MSGLLRWMNLASCSSFSIDDVVVLSVLLREQESAALTPPVLADRFRYQPDLGPVLEFVC